MSVSILYIEVDSNVYVYESEKLWCCSDCYIELPHRWSACYYHWLLWHWLVIVSEVIVQLTLRSRTCQVLSGGDSNINAVIEFLTLYGMVCFCLHMSTAAGTTCVISLQVNVGSWLNWHCWVGYATIDILTLQESACCYLMLYFFLEKRCCQLYQCCLWTLYLYLTDRRFVFPCILTTITTFFYIFIIKCCLLTKYGEFFDECSTVRVSWWCCRSKSARTLTGSFYTRKVTTWPC